MSQIKRNIATTLAAVASLTMLGFAASASASDDFYVGAATGQSKTSDLRCFVTCRTSTGAGKIYGGYTFDVSPTANGMQFKSSLEASIFRIHDMTADFPTIGGFERSTGSTSGLVLAYKADFGNDTFGVTSRIGANFSKSNVDFSNLTSYTGKRDIFPAFGLGARYSVTKNIDLTIDWERVSARYSKDTKATHNMVNFGAAFKF